MAPVLFIDHDPWSILNIYMHIVLANDKLTECIFGYIYRYNLKKSNFLPNAQYFYFQILAANSSDHNNS